MKSLVLQNSKAIIEEVPDPVAHDEWVVVKIESTPICGSDKNAFYSETPIRTAGHEGAGIVVSVDKSSLLKVNDRVILNPLAGCGICRYCRSGQYIYCPNKHGHFNTHFAEYVLVQDFVCTPLPDDISYDIGAMACCALGPAFSSIKRLHVAGFDNLLITGLGPVGMGAVVLAKFLGAQVIAVESIPFRKNLALELGADVVLNPTDLEIMSKIRQAQGKAPLLKAIECSGNEKAERLCIDSMEPLGCISFIGQNHNPFTIYPSEDFINKGLTLMGTWHYNLIDFEDMYAVLRRIRNIDKLITATYGFDEVQEAFERFLQGDACKVILRPWG
jgi:L-iditol 2-dehydrogenase